MEKVKGHSRTYKIIKWPRGTIRQLNKMKENQNKLKKVKRRITKIKRNARILYSLKEYLKKKKENDINTRNWQNERIYIKVKQTMEKYREIIGYERISKKIKEHKRN